MAIPMHMDHMHWQFSGDIMSWNFGFLEDYAFRATDVSIAALVDAGLCLRGDDLGERVTSADAGTPPPINEAAVGELSDGRDITARSIVDGLSESQCKDRLLDLPSPMDDDRYDRDVWEDAYDSCFSETVLSGDEDRIGLSRCERYVCYSFANCKALGESVCAGPTFR